ncbi:ribosomal RNA small subunit methyltransferase A [Patescibacteria group bacterium]|nr:ribosomal RNA small subunit methyltransferase A [Patescibacteria group bacterium]
MHTKKSLGQHFLNSPQIISDIVKASMIDKDEIVIEIGPGEGVLTKALLESGAKVIAIEKDDRLIPELHKSFMKEIALKQLQIVHADILDVEIPHIAEGPYKIVANIPYYITGQIIRMFLESDHQPRSMTLLVQKEVAERIVAKDKKESLLSLSVKAFGDPIYVRTVGRGAFSPQPNVDSAVLYIEKISKKRLQNVREAVFFQVIHAGFAHKRKQLLPNLTLIYKKDKLLKAFDILNLDPKARAEDISLETWIKFCKTIVI